MENDKQGDDPILDKIHHELFHLVEEIKNLSKELKEINKSIVELDKTIFYKGND